ncbi:MAG: HAMP domain-containing histidine kinase [Lachnospiraceae bacterium]|nr:HAMP domain-containing histidine kinase [Lachnospiraceae bacterium]
MRQSILWRFITAYLIFFLFGIVMINYYTSSKIYRISIKDEASSLFTITHTVDNFIDSNNPEDITSYTDSLDKLALKNKCSLTLTSTEGKIYYSNGIDSSTDAIPDFNISHFENTEFTVDNFFGFFDSSTLNVYLPIERNGNTIGYVFAHEPTSYIMYRTSEAVDIFYSSYFIVMFASCILIFVFLLYVYIPLKEISKATSEYARGNFSYDKLKKATNDEMGDISSSLVFMAHQLNNSEEYQKKFISNISHDFRSPLTSIKGYVEAMIDGTIPVESQNKYLNIVLSETNRLKNLTNGLIDLNNWGGLKLALNYEDFILDDVITEIIDSFEGQCSKKNVKIELESKHPNSVHADRSKIQQVLYNLIDNAVKFSLKNTTIKVSLFSKGDRVYCSVKDSGIGVSEDELTKIWDRFYKTDSSRGKDKTGSGIGLSIVKEIINAHQQTIDVISTEGVGTEFIFSVDKSKKKNSNSSDKTN